MSRYVDRARSAELRRLAQEIPVLRQKVRRIVPVAPGLPDDAPDPIEWAERVSGQKLDPWQKQVLLSTAAYFLMNCSRQVGKTQIVSLKAAYNARHRRRHVVALAPTLRQSSKIHDRAYSFLVADGVKFTKETATELKLETGGSVIALPGDRPDMSIRSETVDDLMVDEASRVKDSLITAASPTTATRPDATISYLSSPAGKRGAFYKAWKDETGPWERFSIKAQQCPRISQAFLDFEFRNLGPIMFRQEYECEFIADATAVLDPEDIAAMFANPGAPEAGKVDWTREKRPTHDDWAKVGMLQ